MLSKSITLRFMFGLFTASILGIFASVSALGDVIDSPMTGVDFAESGRALTPTLTAGATDRSSAGIMVLRWNNDATKVAIGRNDGTIEIRDIASNTAVYLGESVAVVTALAWHPTNKNLIAVGHLAPRVRVFDVSTGERLLNLDTGLDLVSSVTWRSDGQVLAASANSYFAASNRRYRVKMWNAPDGALLYDLEGHRSEINDLEFSPKPGDSKLISADQYGQLILWDGASGAQITSWQFDVETEEVAWDTFGDRFAVVTSDNIIRFWDVNQSTIQEIAYQGTSVRKVVWSPDSAKLIFIDSLEMRVYQVWPERPYVSNIISRSTTAIDWSTDDYIAYSGIGNTLEIMQAPFEDDPELAPTPTGDYTPPPETATPFGTPPPPTTTPYPYPIPDAGESRIVGTTNGISAQVDLDASGTVDPGNVIVLYRWFNGDVEIGQGIQDRVTLNVGVHDIELVVYYLITETSGESRTDTVQITVVALPTPILTDMPIPTSGFTYAPNTTRTPTFVPGDD